MSNAAIPIAAFMVAPAVAGGAFVWKYGLPGLLGIAAAGVAANLLLAGDSDGFVGKRGDLASAFVAGEPGLMFPVPTPAGAMMVGGTFAMMTRGDHQRKTLFGAAVIATLTIIAARAAARRSPRSQGVAPSGRFTHPVPAEQVQAGGAA